MQRFSRRQCRASVFNNKNTDSLNPTSEYQICQLHNVMTSSSASALESVFVSVSASVSVSVSGLVSVSMSDLVSVVSGSARLRVRVRISVSVSMPHLVSVPVPVPVSISAQCQECQCQCQCQFQCLCQSAIIRTNILSISAASPTSHHSRLGSRRLTPNPNLNHNTVASVPSIQCARAGRRIHSPRGVAKERLRPLTGQVRQPSCPLSSPSSLPAQLARSVCPLDLPAEVARFNVPAQPT